VHRQRLLDDSCSVDVDDPDHHLVDDSAAAHDDDNDVDRAPTAVLCASST
jgi:hypothetical protein